MTLCDAIYCSKPKTEKGKFIKLSFVLAAGFLIAFCVSFASVLDWDALDGCIARERRGWGMDGNGMGSGFDGLDSLLFSSFSLLAFVF